MKTRAVACMGMVTGLGPQLKTMIPPWATAATSASEVQLCGVPFPITWAGLDVLTARASAGTEAFPLGLPGRGQEEEGGWVVGGEVVGGVVGVVVVGGIVVVVGRVVVVAGAVVVVVDSGVEVVVGSADDVVGWLDVVEDGAGVVVPVT